MALFQPSSERAMNIYYCGSCFRFLKKLEPWPRRWPWSTSPRPVSYIAIQAPGDDECSTCHHLSSHGYARARVLADAEHTEDREWVLSKRRHHVEAFSRAMEKALQAKEAARRKAEAEHIARVMDFEATHTPRVCLACKGTGRVTARVTRPGKEVPTFALDKRQSSRGRRRLPPVTIDQQTTCQTCEGQGKYWVDQNGAKKSHPSSPSVQLTSPRRSRFQ